LLAGDFLSPVFVGIAYRDIFPIGALFSNEALDRTGLLEQAFERWYREVTGSSGACAASDNTGMCRRLGHLPSPPAANQTGGWMPLLFVNGTSVTTGRRILVSDVKIDCLQDRAGAFLNPERATARAVATSMPRSLPEAASICACRPRRQ